MASFLFNRTRPRNRNHILGQAGNSMNTKVCGAVWIYAVLFLRPKDSNAWDNASSDLIDALKTALQGASVAMRVELAVKTL